MLTGEGEEWMRGWRCADWGGGRVSEVLEVC